MKRVLPLFLAVITVVLAIMALFQSGGVERRALQSAGTHEQAARLMLSQNQTHTFDDAYARLANRNDVDKNTFIHEFTGSYGSLLTISALEGFDVGVLHASDEEATVRAKLHYATGVGPLDDTRDLTVQRTGDTWKVVWPVDTRAKLPPQVIPVNYLRWDGISRGSSDDGGAQNVDGPQVRFVSMNAIQRPDSVVVLGEVVNEDSVPAYVNVGATLLGPNDEELAQESSFDKSAHTLLPRQVSPYRIDFPNMRL